MFELSMVDPSFVPMSGVRCPTCATNYKYVWVISGRACGNCGTGC